MPDLEKVEGTDEVVDTSSSVERKREAVKAMIKKSKLKKAMSLPEKIEKNTYHYNAENYDFHNVIVKNFTPSDEASEFIKSKGFRSIRLNKGTTRCCSSSLYYSPHSWGKTIGILFSGGLDSVYLMLRALEETDYNILPITFDFNNDWVLRTINLDIIKEAYPNRILPEYQFGEFFVTDGMHVDNVGQQPTVHFLLGFMDKEKYRALSEIQIGYVRGDTAASFQTELQNIYKSSVLTQKYNIPNAVVPLTYPSIKLTKGEEAGYLSEWESTHHTKLAVVSCENPSFLYYMNEDDDLIITVEVCNTEGCMCHSCNVNHYVDSVSLPSYIIHLPNTDSSSYDGFLGELNSIERKRHLIKSFNKIESKAECEDTPIEDDDCPEDPADKVSVVERHFDDGDDDVIEEGDDWDCDIDDSFATKASYVNDETL